MDYKIQLTDEQEKALQVIRVEIFNETGKETTGQFIIDEQVNFYIKRMFQDNIKIPIPKNALEGLTDSGQAELYAKVINYFPGFVDEMKKEDEPALGMWARIKNFIHIGG